MSGRKFSDLFLSVCQQEILHLRHVYVTLRVYEELPERCAAEQNATVKR